MKRYSFRMASLMLGVATVVGGAAQANETRSSFLSAEIAAGRPTAPMPVRLPPIEVLVFESAAAGTPFLLAPIASLDLHEFQTAPAVKLGIGQPTGEKPSIGGWISFGGGYGKMQ